MKFEYSDESDPGPYPIPRDAPIEGGEKSQGDRHVLVIDRDHGRLYELFATRPPSGGKGWEAGSGAIFDLNSNRLRPAGWTSADAAGLPIFPGLVRYDEVVGLGSVRHAFRFTVRRSRRAYVHPACHFASHLTETDLSPMGMRVRLQASYDARKFPPQARVVLEALKSHGMILADNGGDWYVSGVPTRAGTTKIWGLSSASRSATSRWWRWARWSRGENRVRPGQASPAMATAG